MLQDLTSTGSDFLVASSFHHGRVACGFSSCFSILWNASSVSLGVFSSFHDCLPEGILVFTSLHIYSNIVHYTRTME